MDTETLAVFAAALGGALVGGITASVGSYRVTRATDRRTLRVEVYDELLPTLLREVRFHVLVAHEQSSVKANRVVSMLDQFQSVIRKAAAASRADYLRSRDLQSVISDIGLVVRAEAADPIYEFGGDWDVDGRELQGPLRAAEYVLRRYQAYLEHVLTASWVARVVQRVRRPRSAS